MKKPFYTILLALLVLALPAQAEDWTYDFETFATDINSQGPRKAIEATLNGLEWHMYGVRNNADGNDYHDGQGSMRIYGEVGSVTKPGNEITNFTLMTPRSIGTVSFTLCANAYWSAYQVAWILQCSTDGKSWTTVGTSFTATETPRVIERTVNLESGYIRIVRADYDTFDLSSQSSYSYITNIDNFRITDASGDPVVLQASVAELDFGTLMMGEKSTKEFTLTFSGVETTDLPLISVVGTNASAFTVFTVEPTSESTPGQQIVAVTCAANQRGDLKAALQIEWCNYSTSVILTAKAEKDENILFSGGTGTAEDPYRISCASDILELSYNVEYEKNNYSGTYFLVTNDFSMKDATNFRPIGNNFGREGADAIRPFSGVFDGDGHTISDISMNWDVYGFAGLFGIISNATVKNLTINNSSFYAGYGVAAIAGTALNSTISGCQTTSSVSVSDYYYYAAGICAGALGGTVEISDCFNAATVSGEYGYTAGIISTSDCDGLTIARCGNNGTISDNNSSAAGIICSSANTISIKDCYNSGDVFTYNDQGAANTFAAGIMATIEANFNGSISIANCYNRGAFAEVSMAMAPIFPFYLVDGLDLTISNCYYASDINTYPYDELDNNPLCEVESMLFKDMRNASFAEMLNGGATGVWTFNDELNDGCPVPTNLQYVGIRPIGLTPDAPAINVENGRIAVSGQYDSLQVFDLNGRLVSPAQVLPQGVYVVRTTSQGRTATRKVCVTR